LLQLAIIAVYFLAVIGIGLTGLRRRLRFDEYMTAGRKFSLPFITGSLLATIIGGSATIGLAGLAFSRGITGAWWLLVGSIGLIVLGYFFASKIRNFGFYTLPQIIEKHYGRHVSLAASILIVLAWTGVTAAQIIAAGKILSVLGIGSSEIWIITFTLIFVGYAITGGQYSIIRTDILDIIIIFVGIFCGLVVLLAKTGGLEGLLSSIPISKLSFPVSSSFELQDLLTYLLIVGLTYVVGPDLYSRLFCARDGGTARQAAFWTAAMIVPLAFGITLIGMGASVVFPNIPAEQAFPQLITKMLPSVVAGLVLAALVSAIMSTAVATLWSSSTILSVNVIGYFVKLKGDQKSLLLSRLCVVIIGLVSLGLALMLKGVITTIVFAYTIYTCGVIVPTICGFYKEKIKLTSNGALAGMIGGGLTGLASKLLTIKYLDIGAIVISLALLLAVSWIENRLRRLNKPANSMP
jgi:solute:Na+ symporter, SSS family